MTILFFSIILFFLLVLISLCAALLYKQNSSQENTAIEKTLLPLLEKNAKFLETNLINRFTDIANQQRGQLDSFYKQIEMLRKNNDEKMAQVIEVIEKKIRRPTTRQ